MKNRTNRMLLAVFLVGLFLYLILVFLFINFGAVLIRAPAAQFLYYALFWLTVGGHGVPIFALQLLLCRQTGRGKFFAAALTILIFTLLCLFIQGVVGAHGWDVVGWYLLMMYTIAPAVGCVLAWLVWGLSRRVQRKPPAV